MYAYIYIYIICTVCVYFCVCVCATLPYTAFEEKNHYKKVPPHNCDMYFLKHHKIWNEGVASNACLVLNIWFGSLHGTYQ